MRGRKVKSLSGARQGASRESRKRMHSGSRQGTLLLSLSVASANPIPTKHPKPHGRFPTIHSNLPHYIRTQTQIPRRHLNLREPQSILIFTKNAPTPSHYSFPGIRQPLRLLSQPRHAPPPERPAPCGEEEAPKRVQKRARPLAPSLQLSRQPGTNLVSLRPFVDRRARDAPSQ